MLPNDDLQYFDVERTPHSAMVDSVLCCFVTRLTVLVICSAGAYSLLGKTQAIVGLASA